jgi:hypothetical protein
MLRIAMIAAIWCQRCWASNSGQAFLSCHSERSEESTLPQVEILRSLGLPQDDSSLRFLSRFSSLRAYFFVTLFLPQQ